MSKKILRNILKLPAVFSSRTPLRSATCSILSNVQSFTLHKPKLYSTVEQTLVSPKIITPVSPRSAFRCSVNNPVKILNNYNQTKFLVNS